MVGNLSLIILVSLLTINLFGQFPELANVLPSLINHDIKYDPSYYKIPYPMGDVPADRGVCTDVVIRAYRKIGIDLQQLIHEDMKQRFWRYPQKYGLKEPDSNIDHRRIPNLVRFFEFYGEELPISWNPGIYKPGDIVVWDLSNADGKGILHIGIVSDSLWKERDRKVLEEDGVDVDAIPDEYILLHNIGRGQRLNGNLFQWQIIYHYRYLGEYANKK